MYLLKLLTGTQRRIVSCRNSGMGDNLSAAASAWWYARQTGRSLSICWFHSRYLTNRQENAFSRFFELPEEIQGVPVGVEPRADRCSSFALMHWSFLVPYPDLPGMGERVIHRTVRSGRPSRQTVPRTFAWSRRQEAETLLIRQGVDAPQRVLIASGCYSPVPELKPFYAALRLKPDLSARVEEFAARHFHNKTVIGVHIRYYDPTWPRSNHSAFWADPEQTLKRCLQLIEQAVSTVGTSDYIIFLSTDSRRVRDYICAHAPRVVTLDKLLGVDCRRELHEELPVETAAATPVEMFLLARSHVLIRLPANSWFSHYASLYARKINS